MTDAEIIKALECCSHEAYDCDVCPLNLKEEELCFIEVRKYALDLINRQEAEIEDLNKSRNGLLRKSVSAYHEGIRYLAERLCEGRVSNDPVVIAVKTELKMTGDTE